VSDHLKLDGGHLIHNAAGDLVTECGGQYTFDIYPGHSTDWNISEKFTPGAARARRWSNGPSIGGWFLNPCGRSAFIPCFSATPF